MYEPTYFYDSLIIQVRPASFLVNKPNPINFLFESFVLFSQHCQHQMRARLCQDQGLKAETQTILQSANYATKIHALLGLQGMQPLKRVRNWICLCASGAIYELERSCRQLNDSHPLILCAILSHPLWSAHHHSVRQAAVMRLHIFSRSCHLSLPGSNFSLDLIHFMISPCCKGSG